MAPSATNTAAPTIRRVSTCSSDMPRKVPKSRPVTLSRMPLYKLTKSTPQARAKAWTVPITAASPLVLPPVLDGGTMAITRAAAMLAAK